MTTDGAQYMPDEILPCGHSVPLFEAVDGDLIPIANPAYPGGFGTTIPATVWCVESARPSCGWVEVNKVQYDRIAGYRRATQ